MRAIREIIVHCAATRPSWMQGQSLANKVAEITRWHKARGWSDIGYHFIIDRSGAVAKGRAVSRTGAHVSGRNSQTIGICLLGGHGSTQNDAFRDNYTQAQDTALRELIAQLKSEHPNIKTVSGHNQFSAKACPGFSVPRWYAQQQPTRKITESKTLIGATTAGTGTVAAEATREVQALLSA